MAADSVADLLFQKSDARSTVFLPVVTVSSQDEAFPHIPGLQSGGPATKKPSIFSRGRITEKKLNAKKFLIVI